MPSVPDVVSHMIKIRDARSALKADFTEKDNKLKEQWEKGEAFLMRHLQDSQLESAKFESGTIFTKTNLRSSVKDKAALKDFLRENPDELDLLTLSVSSTNLKAWMERTGANEPPPGVVVSPELSLNIRRPNASKKGASDE